MSEPRRPIIVQGREEPLARVPFHADGPLRRWFMAGKSLDPRLGCYVAIHQFTDVPSEERAYCDPHAHDYDEVNIFHTTSSLEVDVTLDGEHTLVRAPATVYIPAGVKHAANVRSGSGFMVAFLMDGEFRTVD